MAPEPAHIQLAQPDDLDAMLEVMDQANQYARIKSGEPQWTAMEHARGELRNHLEQGNCYVIKTDGIIDAIMTLTEEDTYSWGEGTDQKALYFHKLMKNPESSVLNPGRIFLAFAAKEALKRGRAFLRCDAKPSMRQLIKYYERFGFRQKRFTHYPTTGQQAVLLEADPTKVLKYSDI